MRIGLLWVCLLVASVLPLPGQTADARLSRIDELRYFLGQWECSGKFARSGAGIEAHLQFESILDGSFVLFRHDDKPPHNYHAWTEWGWDNATKQFVAMIQDSTVSMRTFHSAGWDTDRLAWEGGSQGNSDQQFVFERVSPEQFRLSYAVYKDGAWAPVDTSTCSRGKR